ncbi:MAG: dockerin type I domain-containing protein, partial [Planctomycetota bacterium]|nr:dockerin type I domain-containing protein [Planctomycetota bacterium]
GVRDPGDSGIDTVQSTFTNRFWDFTRRTVYRNTGGGIGPLVGVDELYRDTPPSSSNRMRILEGYISVVPRQGITWEPYDDGFRVLTPDGPVWNNGVFDLDIGFLPEVLDVVPGPYGRTIYLRTELGKLLCIRLADASILELVPPDLTSPIQGFEIDAFERLGLITPTDFRVYSLNNLQADPRIVPLKFAPTDLAWIEWSGPRDGPWFKPRAVVLGGADQRLSIVKLVDGAPPSVVTYAVPSSIPLKETTRMVYGGSPASFFFMTEGMVHRAAFNQQGELEEVPMQLAGVGEVDDLDVDDQDRLVVSTQGKTIAFRQTDNFNWVVDPEHPFIDLPVNRRFRMVRSRSNWDPRFEDVPSQEPDPLVPKLPFEPDCLGDLDLDGQVNGADLALLLAAWLEERSIADLDRSGRVDGADLALLLGAWGQCSQ